MLAAGAHADVQRRLPALGVQRALGFTPRADRGAAAARGRARRAAGGALGLAVGRLAVAGPAADLLAALNEPAPARALALLLVARVAGSWSSVVAAAAAWPAWRAARRPPARSCAAATSTARPARRRCPRRRAGGLGVAVRDRARRRAASRRSPRSRCARASSCSMLALASLLERLRDDPRHGRQALPAHRPAPARCAAARSRRLPGVADAASATRSTPPTRSGSASRAARRLPRRPHALRGAAARGGPAAARAGRGRGRASGWRDALGLRPGLDARGAAAERARGALPRRRRRARARSARPDRLGRAPRLLAAEPALRPTIAVRVVRRVGVRSRARRARRAGWSPRLGRRRRRRRPGLGVAQRRLRRRRSWRCCARSRCSTALVCLYALVQALALTAGSGGRVAVLRACGGSRARCEPLRGSASRSWCWLRRRPRRRAAAGRAAAAALAASYVSLSLGAGRGRRRRRRGLALALSWLPRSWAGGIRGPVTGRVAADG